LLLAAPKGMGCGYLWRMLQEASDQCSATGARAGGLTHYVQRPAGSCVATTVRHLFVGERRLSEQLRAWCTTLGAVQLHNCMGRRRLLQVVAHSCEETQAGEVSGCHRSPMPKQVLCWMSSWGRAAGAAESYMLAARRGARVSEWPGRGTAFVANLWRPGSRMYPGDRVRYLQR